VSIKNWIVLYFFGWTILFVQAQTELGNPFIRNFTPEEYQAYPQNWAIVQDQLGIIYAANNNGIMEFDGQRWSPPIPVSNKSTVRSLGIDSRGTIYYGAKNDFGCLGITANGQRVIISFKDKLQETDQEFLDVWNIFATSQGVYFITGEKVFLWNYQIIFTIEIKASSFSFAAHDHVFIRSDNEKIYLLNGTQPLLLPHTDIFNQAARRISILPYDNQEILIVTADIGLFVYDLKMLFRNKSPAVDFSNIPASILRPFPADMQGFFKKNSWYCSIRLNNHLYAFGSRTGGIAIMNHRGQLIQTIDTNNGLQDNAVWNLFADRHQNLWAALNYGISVIETSSPLSQFTRFNQQKIMVLSCIRHRGILYAGTFNGIFYLSQAGNQQTAGQPEFLPVKNTRTSCWDFLRLNHHLLALGSNQIYRITADKAYSLLNVNNPLCLGQSFRYPDHVFVGLNSKLIALKIKNSSSDSSKTDGKIMAELVDTGSFGSIKDSIRQIVADFEGNLWLTTKYNGIYHLEFSGRKIDDFRIFHYTDTHGLPALDFNRVEYINQQIVVATQKGIYQPAFPLAPGSDKSALHFMPKLGWGKIFHDQNIEVANIFQDKNKNIWINSGSGLGIMSLEANGSYPWNPLPFKKIKGGASFIFFDNHETAWICVPESRSLFRFDATANKNYTIPFAALIRQVKTLKDNTILFYGNYYDTSSKTADCFFNNSLLQPAELIIALPYQKNSLALAYGATFFENDTEIRFAYKLADFDDQWSEWLPDSKKEYSNLPEGNYIFGVKARNVFAQESSPAFFRFSITPPWQRTVWAYLGYGLLGLFLFYAGIRLNSARLNAAKEKLEKIVTARTREIVRQRDEIFFQKEEISKQKDEIQTFASELTTANQQLIETKNALWGEMALAKKIQTVLLPENPRIPGYEITAYMQPADEVGGDYYDVICIDNNNCRGGSCARPPNSGQSQGADPQHPNMGNHQGLPLQDLPQTQDPNQPPGFAPSGLLSTNHLSLWDHSLTPAPDSSYWLAIGDVSGHGVPAGLVMMMVQTSIRSVLDNMPHASPEKILESVNRVIYENIKKLGEDKYMSITLMAVQGNGTIYYSGLHQDMLIYRAEPQTVETVETKGMWLGMMENIEQLLPVEKLFLKSGDTLLLYTDGITEANRPDNEMYGEAKLAAMLTEHGSLPVEALKSTLLASLEAYACNDDITLMIIKRL
jgi:serine phosphatase RsbU (regulator of sigma subunit)